jgi:hypothetical protein
MGREIKGHLSHCGRVISAEELADIRETVATCFRLSRSELARTIGEHLEWYSASWSKDERLKNLGLVINNSRFLIFPWVKIKSLASHALDQAVRRIGDDW